jgi:catechol 2,3-dioxygenase-like lactoylglutathione lyase family enzyme
MTNTTRHVGIVVKDLTKTTDFWTNLIGFKLHIDAKEVSPYIDDLLGIANPELRTVKLIDENGFIIELLEFANYPAEGNWEGNLVTTGLTHIALTVNNLNTLALRLEENGYKLNSKIKTSPTGLVNVVFVKGPEGLLLELVEELPGS